MAKFTLHAAGNAISEQQAALTALLERIESLERRAQASAEREQTAALVIADLRAQLQAKADAGGSSTSTEPQPLSQQPDSWWAKLGLTHVPQPAEDAAVWVADLGYRDNPYAWLLRTPEGKVLAVRKPQVTEKLVAEGRFTLPPDTRYVCFIN